LHLSSDSPIQFHSILYCPQSNFELLGFGNIEHGVNLCAKRVLVQEDCGDLLPEYLRFLYGVVDSGAQLEIDDSGLGPVRLVEHGQLAALCSDVGDEPLGRRRELTREPVRFSVKLVLGASAARSVLTVIVQWVDALHGPRAGCESANRPKRPKHLQKRRKGHSHATHVSSIKPGNTRVRLPRATVHSVKKPDLPFVLTFDSEHQVTAAVIVPDGQDLRRQPVRRLSCRSEVA